MTTNMSFQAATENRSDMSHDTTQSCEVSEAVASSAVTPPTQHQDVEVIDVTGDSTNVDLSQNSRTQSPSPTPASTPEVVRDTLNNR